ncbi:MAG: GGDEF domain-containing protein, partial [Solirubrobacterales bacterium]
ATLLFALVRMAYAVMLEGRLEVTRAQALTDELTQLGNRRLLLDDLDHFLLQAHADSPGALVLFDLNGFKHYNDTFGHPAGDKMLGMLGKRLGLAMEGVPAEATAYRLGGDEFLIFVEGGIVDIGLGARDELAVRAAEALTSRGRGFDLSASWGIASVPEEADSPAEAMQLADVRMYAQKESRRLASSIEMPDSEAVEQRY